MSALCLLAKIGKYIQFGSQVLGKNIHDKIQFWFGFQAKQKCFINGFDTF